MQPRLCRERCGRDGFFRGWPRRPFVRPRVGVALEGWRHVKVTDRHTAIDYARILEDLSDRHLPNANKIVLVQGRVEAWRAGFRSIFGSLLARPFVCECPIISAMPRFQAPPRRTQHADFPHYAPPFASCQGLWTYSAKATFSLSRRTL
jgi:hypothetical protein